MADLNPLNYLIEKLESGVHALRVKQSGSIEVDEVKLIKKVDSFPIIGDVLEPYPEDYKGAITVFGLPQYCTPDNVQDSTGEDIRDIATNDDWRTQEKSGIFYLASRYIKSVDKYGNFLWEMTEGDARFEGIDVYGNPVGIYAVNRSGEVWKISEEGEGEIIFDYEDRINAIHVDRTNEIYLGTSDRSVIKIDSGGNEVWSENEVTSGRIYGLGVLGDYVYAICENGDLAKIEKETGSTDWVEKIVSEGYDLAIDKINNKIYIPDDGSVYEVDTNGNYNSIGSADASERGHGVDVDRNGNVFAYFGDSGGEENVSVMMIDKNKNRVYDIILPTWFKGAAVGSLSINSEGDLCIGGDGSFITLYSELQPKGQRMVD